jgi:glycerate-2-kinase
VGGRNQEFALAAALRIADSPYIVVGAVDSDGTDGPGGQFFQDGFDIACLAGGLVDGGTAAEAIAAQVDIRKALTRHDTTPALWRLGSGILATQGISLTDLGVVLITGRT